MNAPLPVLTSITSASRPGRELLRQDRGGDQRNRFDRRGDVADGVEAAVGRREVGGLADDGAAGLAHDLAEAARCRAWCGSRGCAPACRACRRCGRGRGRRSSARSRRRPRAIGASIRLTLSPTPPVECLSTTGPGRRGRQSSTRPDCRPWRGVSATRSSRSCHGRTPPWRTRRPGPRGCCPSVSPSTKNVDLGRRRARRRRASGG